MSWNQTKKEEEKRESPASNCNLVHCVLTIKLALQISTNHALKWWNFWSKLKDKNPSPQENGAGMKNCVLGNTIPKLLPQWIFCAFICMPLITSLPKKHRAAAPHLFALWEHHCSAAELLPTQIQWTAARQASLSITNSQSLLKLMSFASLMPFNYLILCHLLFSPSILPSIRVFSNESVLCIRWPKYWSFSFNISPSNEYSGLISFRIDWFDLLAVRGTLKSLLQHHSSKASILSCSAFFMVQLSRPYVTTGRTIALTKQTFVGLCLPLSPGICSDSCPLSLWCYLAILCSATPSS